MFLAEVTYPFPPPTDTTCTLKPPLPRTGLFPAHWPTTMPAISSFPPCGGIDWIPILTVKVWVTHELVNKTVYCKICNMFYNSLKYNTEKT